MSGKPGFGFAVGLREEANAGSEGGLTRPESERGIKVQEVGSKVSKRVSAELPRTGRRQQRLTGEQKIRAYLPLLLLPPGPTVK